MILDGGEVEELGRTILTLVDFLALPFSLVLTGDVILPTNWERKLFPTECTEVFLLTVPVLSELVLEIDLLQISITV